MERAGGKVVAFSEFNKAAIDTHLANFPHSVHLIDPSSKSGDITKIPDEVFAQYRGVDVVFAGFPCFVAGTLVLTQKGYVPIEKVTFEHKLLTHTGAFQDIVNLQMKPHTGLLYDIKLVNNPSVISSTPEHPFFIRRMTGSQLSDPEWKAARDLDERDYIGMVRKYNNYEPSIQEGDYAWFAQQYIKIREVCKETVYNFEVENDNSYCVENTLVHNCQGVSHAGKKKATDPRNQMFRQFVRAAKAIQPKFVIGENVTGLLTMKSGTAETDPLLFDVIRAEFKKIGYELTHQQIEATEMGVPQKRKRILIVGWKTGTNFDPDLFWSSVMAWGSRQTMPRMREFVAASLVDAHTLSAPPEGFANYALEVAADATVSGTPHPFIVLKAGEKLLSCSKRASPIHSEIVDLDSPSKTIICTYDHQPRLLVGLKRGGESWARTLFADELKQIQGFPSDFILRGNKKEQVVQVGNAVPPALVEGVARTLFP